MAFALHVFQTVSDLNDEPTKPHPLRELLHTVNPKTGRLEIISANLEKMYPNRDDPMSAEYSFEELRAKQHGVAEMSVSGRRGPRIVETRHNIDEH